MSKKYEEIFNYLNITDKKIIKEVINSLEIKKGPTIGSNWITDKILIGKLPKTCEDVEKIIEAGVTLFISLREFEEEYPKCIKKIKEGYNKKGIFFRFDIPNYSIRNVDSIKSLID